jgi:uroporphyrinogen decarboxylase
MNGFDRVIGTLAGKPLDRRGVVPVLSLYGAQLTGCPLPQYFKDPVAYARGQAAVCETFAPDVLFGPFSFAALGEAFGSEVQYFSNQAPNVRRPAIQSFAQWGKCVLPDPDSHPGLLYYREAIQRIAAEHKDQIPVAAVLPAPIDMPVLIMGMESWMETVLFEPEEARRIMEQIIPFFVRLTNNLFEAGATFLALPGGFISPAVVTRELVTSFSRPALATALAQVRGPVVLHHAGAPLLAYLDMLTGLPSVIAYGMDRRDNLKQARQLIGSNPVLFGGPVGPNLIRQTADEVEAECREILTDRQHDPHFMLCTCGADIAWNTPPENIHALKKAAQSFAESPA